MKPTFSFVMPVHNDYRTVKTTIKSILDQDVEDVEVICVVNGDKQEKELKACKSIKDDRVQVYQLEEGNACTARNYGAEKAKGKYLSFLPADAFLYPGMLRKWLDAFNSDETIDVVYGGYRFVDERKLWSEYNKEKDGEVSEQEFAYGGATFDPYLLECSNFIDGSFPVKKEIFDKVKWDKDVKSLQDWDLWIGVMKQGGKFHYISEVFFDTGFPHKGGLSDHSSRNWVEVTKQIREKHNIEPKTICVSGNGAPFHAKNIAKLLKADYREQVNFKPHEFLMVYQIGFYFAMPQMLNIQIENFKTKARKVIHWIGTDVMHFSELLSKQSQAMYLQYFRQNDIVHLCESDFVQKELATLGIEAEIVPLPPMRFFDVRPLPENFTVGVYAPYQRDDFYYTNLIKEVAKELPYVTFKLFGDPTIITKEDNVEYVGYINDMDKFIGDCSALVRLTKHDGMPISIVEFQSAGRNILFNIPVPHSLSISEVTKENVIAGIKELMLLPLNTTGAEYVRDVYSHDKYKEKIYSLIEYNPKRYWENLAEAWDNRATIDSQEKQTLTKLLNKREFDSVLDVGCGNGIWSDLFNDKEYVGIDISEKLIQSAQKRYTDKDFFAIKLEDYKRDNKFDLIFGYTVLQHILPKDIDKAVESLKKLGKKMILVEPMNFQSVNYCHDHDYEKLFKVTRKTQMGARWVFEIDLED